MKASIAAQQLPLASTTTATFMGTLEPVHATRGSLTTHPIINITTDNITAVTETNVRVVLDPVANANDSYTSAPASNGTLPPNTTVHGTGRVDLSVSPAQTVLTDAEPTDTDTFRSDSGT